MFWTDTQMWTQLTDGSIFGKDFIASDIFCDIAGAARNTYLPTNPIAASPKPARIALLAYNYKKHYKYKYFIANYNKCHRSFNL